MARSFGPHPLVPAGTAGIRRGGRTGIDYGRQEEASARSQRVFLSKIEINDSLILKLDVDEQEVLDLLAISLHKYKGIHGSLAGKLSRRYGIRISFADRQERRDHQLRCGWSDRRHQGEV